MNIKHFFVAALAALALGLAAIAPGMNDGQQGVSPTKDSATAWAVSREMPATPAPRFTVAGSKLGIASGTN